MRKQVELLKHHAHFAAHRVDVLEVVVQRRVVDDDIAGLMFLQAIDTADQGRFSRPRGPANDNPFPGVDRQVDVFQDVEVAKPFVDIGQLNNDLVRYVGLEGDGVFGAALILAFLLLGRTFARA